MQQRAMGTDVKKNLGTIDRKLRIVLGCALAISALVLFFAGAGLIWRLVYITLMPLGVEVVISGIRGHCPLYRVLGWSTAQRNTNT